MNKFEISSVKNFAVDFFGKHSATILTGSTIACNVGGIVATYKNSPKIHIILEVARDAFEEAGEDKEKKREIAKQTCKELAPLVAPIIIFFAASSTSAIVNHKKSEAKIAALSAALSLAKTTIDEYDSFKNKVREEVGDDKYQEVEREVTRETVEKKMSSIPYNDILSLRRNGKEICCIPDLGVFFSGTVKEIDFAMKRVNEVLSRNGQDGETYGMTSVEGNEIVTMADILDELDITEHRPLISNKVGWDAGTCNYISYVVDTDLTSSGISYITLIFRTKPEFID